MIRAVLLLAGCTALLAACTGGGSPTPPPRLAPTIIGDPLDMSKLAPCALASANVLAQYHLNAPGQVTSTPAGPACTWSPQTTELPSYTAGVDLHSGGLEGLYHRRASFPIFRPTSVSEYPAVNITTTAPPRGTCTVQVGVANDTLLIVSVTYTNPQALNYTDPCPDADTFAASLIGFAEGKVP